MGVVEAVEAVGVDVEEVAADFWDTVWIITPGWSTVSGNDLRYVCSMI